MPKKKNAAEQGESFLALVDQVAAKNSISREAVITALKEAIKRAYYKQVLGGGDDARVDVLINEESNPVDIKIAYTRKVMKESEITDDYLEISVDDANRGLKKAKYKAGDDFIEYADVSDMRKSVATAVKSILNSNLREFERESLYEAYKDRIGELITGTVEKCDDHGMVVNIGKTSVELTRKDMIGDEDYQQGSPVKVYIQEVKPTGQKTKPTRGNQIEVTRASEGFLKRLFEEEIHEIYEGVVVIKAIAREAGVRSKVAVYSVNDDVEPQGACIGPGGSRIQNVVAQLGNSKDKEKIDIIVYSPYKPLFIANSLRPCDVIGVKMIDENASPRPKAAVIIDDERFSVAIGRKGANSRLAGRLTGYDIDIIPLSKAVEDGIDYVPYAELQAKAAEEKFRKEREEYARKSQIEAAKKASEAAAKEETAKAEKPVEKISPSPVAAPAPEPLKEEAPVVSEPVKVKTSTTLESLEAELEAEKKRKASAPKAKRKTSKPEGEEAAKPAPAAPAAPAVNAMPIYSEEELAEIEAEEENPYDEYDDMDLDDYDDYYDDEN